MIHDLPELIESKKREAELLELMRKCRDVSCQFASIDPVRERGICTGWEQAIQCLTALTNQGPVSRVVHLVIEQAKETK